MEVSRTFIVRITASPQRVIVEDVREHRRAVAGDLAGVGAQIATWLELPPGEPASGDGMPPREDSVSPRT